VSCAPRGSPRWIAAAAPYPQRAQRVRAERTLVLSSCFEIFGKPISAMIPMIATHDDHFDGRKPERAMNNASQSWHILITPRAIA